MKLFELVNGDPTGKRFPCVYMWENNITGKRYIGETTDLYHRMKNYKNGGVTRILSEEVNTFGWNIFELYIIERFDYDVKEEELLDRESYWISKYDTTNPDKGYNTCSYSNHTKGTQLTDETKKKISEASKELWKDQTYRKKQTDRMTGEKNFFYGKHFNGELNPMYGKHHSDETVAKIKEALTGKPNYSAMKKVKCVETGEIFDSLKEAGKMCNSNTSGVHRVVDKPNFACHGYHFVSVEQEP